MSARSLVSSTLGLVATPLPLTSTRSQPRTTCAFVRSQPSAVTAKAVPDETGLSARKLVASPHTRRTAQSALHHLFIVMSQTRKAADCKFAIQQRKSCILTSTAKQRPRYSVAFLNFTDAADT